MVGPNTSSQESNASNEEGPFGPLPSREPTSSTGAPPPQPPSSQPTEPTVVPIAAAVHGPINYQGLSAASVVAGNNIPSGGRRFQIRVAQPPHHHGQMAPTVQFDRATGQLRLDLGHGQVVTIPTPQQHPNLPPHGSSHPHVSIHRHTAAAASTGGPTVQPPPPHRPGFQTVNVVRTVHLPPLLPIPVTTAQPSNHDDNNDDESLARFKCVVCYEFMRDPVGCPSDTCSARFCHSCFVRAAQESTSNNNNNNNNSPTDVPSTSATTTAARPKCPMCRVEFTHFVKDSALQAEMMQQPGGPTVACRHAGCPETKLPLGLVQDHERHCSYETLKCRYVSFGCPWIGRRGDLTTHETHHCALHKVSTLVQKVREMELDHATRLSILQQQTTGALQMLEVYRQNAQRDVLKSNTNLFDIVHFVHVITCSTQHFLHTKERWFPLFRSDEGRAAVTNFLMLLPTVVSCGGMALKGVHTLPRLLMAIDHGHGTSMSADAFNVLLEDSVMGILIGIMLGLMLLANFIDSASSVQWAPFATFPGGGMPPLMCDLMALCLFTMHLTLMDYFGSPYPSLLIWTLLCVTTTVFPAMVWTMSHRSAQTGTHDSPPSSYLTRVDLLTKARSCEPVLFGLRFSIMASLFGIGPMLDAAALTLLVSSYYSPLPLRGQPQQQQPPPPPAAAATSAATPARSSPPRLVAMVFLSTHKNCFLEGLTRPSLVAYLWIRVAMTLAQQGMLIHWNNNNDSNDNGDSSSHGGDLPGIMTLTWTIIKGTATITTMPFWDESNVVVRALLESFVAWVVFGWISVGLNAGMTVGIQWGHWIMNAAEQTATRRMRTNHHHHHADRPDGNEYHLLGVASFGLWVSLVAMLVCVH